VWRQGGLAPALAGLLAICGACTPGGDLPPVPAYDPGTYRLSANDEVRVITYGEDQLTLDYRVDVSGNIEVPLLGNVHAAGLTPSELGGRISALLQERKLLRDPSVAVEVSGYRTVSVLGEVARPGQYPYQPGMTLLTAVATAGGFTYRAVKARARVTRQEEGFHVTGALTPDDYVKPGDVITIFQRIL
jgi:polysaccharide export outer membrane protein